MFHFRPGLAINDQKIFLFNGDYLLKIRGWAINYPEHAVCFVLFYVIDTCSDR